MATTPAHRCLEGIPPTGSGNHVQTRRFLTELKQFMSMNQGATITLNPMRDCAYFLSLIDGPEVEWWIERSYDWPHNVESGKSPLPFDRTAWAALEGDFKRAFVDHAEQGAPATK